jgi:hypothetical protein
MAVPELGTDRMTAAPAAWGSGRENQLAASASAAMACRRSAIASRPSSLARRGVEFSSPKVAWLAARVQDWTAPGRTPIRTWAESTFAGHGSRPG